MIKTRIAPTPSGYLHIGNILSFVYTWLLCKRQGGQIWLRIDDIDAERARPEYIDDIFDSLAWLGLSIDFGPKNRLDFEQNYSQQLRIGRYQALLKELCQTRKVFGCSCSRAQIKASSSNGLYPGICRGRQPNETAEQAWRIEVPTEAIAVQDRFIGVETIDLASTMGDFVVRRKGGLPAYQIASLAEDIDHGINLIVRGQDLLGSTAAQCYLAGLLNNNSFGSATFIHHALITDASGHKLSKSEGAPALKQLRAQGAQPSHIYRMVALWLGLEQTPYTLQELLHAFWPETPPKGASFEMLLQVVE
jgi:glutamyl-tRNA synthetase